MKLSSDSEYVGGMSELIDLREVTIYDVNPEGIRAVALKDKEVNKELRVSRTALVSEKDFVYGMLRMFQSISEGSGIEINVFKDFKDAEKWIGI